jgi:acyl carrier protein
MDIETTLERFILDELLSGRKTALAPDESLISTGILDSLTWLQLVSFIEEKFGVTVTDEDLNPDNFQTINAMTTFIQKNSQ